MSPPTPLTAPRRLRNALLLMLGAFGMAGLVGTETFLRKQPPHTLEDWQTIVFNTGFYWTPWIILMPLVYRLACQWRLDRRLTSRKVLVHVVGMALILAAHLLLMTLLPLFCQWVIYDIPAAWLWKAWLKYPVHLRLSWVASSLYIYPIIVVLASAVEYRKEIRAREIQAARLEARLAQTEWQALKNQLHPRFLFQALKGISTLMHRDLEAAEHMLDLLADLLRRSLRESSLQELPLHQEVAFVTQYLDIERLRLGGDLRVEVLIDADCADAIVPHRILQPLVENAVRHGLEPFNGRGLVRLRASSEDHDLHLQVSNGAPASPGWREGAGLTGLRARLAQLYPNRTAMAFDLQDGFAVHLKLPLKVSRNTTSDPGGTA